MLIQGLEFQFVASSNKHRLWGGVFEEIFIHTEASLPLEFRRTFKHKFYKEDGTVSRGFGYWVWKPKVILMALEELKENDILFYLDIGFEFNSSKSHTLREWINQINQNEIMGMIANFPEKNWQKMDTLVHFGLDKNEEFLNSMTYAAGFIALKKTAKNIKIIQEWMKVFYEHWEFVDDSPSKIPNLACFIENRHDQAIWNIIAKLNGVKAFPAEFYHQAFNQPLQYFRNKIYLPHNAEQTKTINEMIRYKGRGAYQLNPLNLKNNILEQSNEYHEYKILQAQIHSKKSKKQDLKLLNLEQELINKKLKTKKYAKQLGLKNDEVIMPRMTLIQANCAKARIYNHLAYKLGQSMIKNSKTFLSYMKMPYILIALSIAHREEQKIKCNDILPPLESYPDYKEALKEKECFTYKLGLALMKANKAWYKGGYLIFFFKELPRLKKEFKHKNLF